MVLVVPEGASAVRLGNAATIKTKVKVAKGMFYAISFSASRTCAQEQTLMVSISQNTQPKDWGFWPIQTIYSCDGWDSYSWGFRANSSDTEILIHNSGLDKDPAWGPIISRPCPNPLDKEDANSPLPRWMIESLKAVKYIDSDHFRVPEGKRAVELVAGRESAIAQLVRTTPGKPTTSFSP
ncbi:hypothetical protein SASPL_107967 [Salvia splendens]|uniref:DUF642 domain-containing protein n=1 Tax=Salvia splendens TaxID=180675 RepID=A0A8X8YDE4_SALSN|nr:hypothetical protein SASPL_107967 [Salvia splendens]